MCGRPGGGSGPASLGRGGLPASPTATPAGALVPPAERLPLDHPDFDPNPDSAPYLRTRGPPGLVCWFALSDCHGDTHPSGHFHFHVFTRCDTFVSAPAACYLSRSPPVRLASCPTLARSSPVLSTLFRTLTLVPRWRRRRLLAGTHLRPAIVASLYGLTVVLYISPHSLFFIFAICAPPGPVRACV
eukprot:scaffold21608_cov130-Isochrysis_galbana.AAC.3